MPNVFNNNTRDSKIYEQLKRCEQQWWQARQRFIMLRERQMFWFGDNSHIMWLMWQLVSYIGVAIVLMLLSKLFSVQFYIWHYIVVFGVQTLFFITMFALKGKLANHLQRNIDNADMEREQALNEMTILASDSIFPDIHAHAPISLHHIYKRYESQLRLASLHFLLQKEIDAGRLILGEQQMEYQVLPPELADDELIPYADEMIYKSLMHTQ